MKCCRGLDEGTRCVSAAPSNLSVTSYVILTLSAMTKHFNCSVQKFICSRFSFAGSATRCSSRAKQSPAHTPSACTVPRRTCTRASIRAPVHSCIHLACAPSRSSTAITINVAPASNNRASLTALRVPFTTSPANSVAR